MKFIKEIDTGEIIPIPDNDEELVYDQMPTLFKDDVVHTTNIKCDGEPASQNLVDVIFELQDKLKDEKKQRTIYHKFPFTKIIATVAICTAIVFVGVLGIRYVSSVNLTPDEIITESSNNYSEDDASTAVIEQASDNDSDAYNSDIEEENEDTIGISTIELVSRLLSIIAISIAVVSLSSTIRKIILGF